MSKKKASGNTMTLKDFHGGSIPTDISLPSAPGVIVRPSERSGFDRPSSWGYPISRPDHRSRPHTSPVTRHYDDKTPFLTHAGQIGRTFDEDERKPLDGGLAPRRTISDESIWAPASRVEVKSEYGLGGSSLGRQVAFGSQYPVGTVNSYSTMLTEAIQLGLNSHKLGGCREQGSGGVHPNVWMMRKEAMSVPEMEQSAWSASDSVSKFAHASAIEKVSSGRWQSKAVHYQTDIEDARTSEVESGPRTNVNRNNTYNRMDSMGEKEYHDAMLARHAERGLSIDDQMQGRRHKMLDYERSRVSKHSDLGPRSMGYRADGVQPARNDGKLGGSELPHSIPSEATERPKLKLLPRTKPVEISEPSGTDHVQEYWQVSDSGHVRTVNQVREHANLKPFPVGTESGKEVGQRPKLNFKPQLQPIEKLELNTERERNALFGGARPRELVLKERGIDNVAINNYEVVEHPIRIEHNVGRNEKYPHHSTQTRHGGKTEDAISDQRAGKKPERKDQRADSDRLNAQRRNRRGDNQGNPGENERQPSPETWRKRVEDPKPDVAGQRYVKATSAVELAQTFSTSVSDPKVNERFPAQRGMISGRVQVPFSRLVDPTPKPQINGY